ncbi:2-hydroxyhepta-2,4-diene-1,7-dioate isomerase [Pusillimonas sp. T2]|uniref:fumarylacetoacetate hydrolase family protein n=1 Tax=Pusillimonas sp. T2 TaxID=1548123 RepID=UPI000B8B3B8D|nr:fumarylacetoacetate hydrolase family protein [Pusillimonas sp. T2]OXR48075.1 2-hydroxyhepta-2,4-diene-1,7-dioate isomerase [Pusillimonas sp. T2]
MKLLRFGAPGQERPGALGQDGKIRDLSAHVSDITPANLSPSGLSKLNEIDLNKAPIVEGDVRIGAPVKGIRQVIAIGLNYADHAAESNMPIPQEPIVFIKAVSSVCGPNDPIIKPPHSTRLDWEIELGVVIGTEMDCVSETDALKHVAGYCVANDVSERAFQFELGGTWDKGKGFPNSCPLGPYLVTADSIDDPQSLSMWLDVNGERKQTGNTKTMVFDCAVLLSYVSHFMRLLPGDVVVTGTPPGVGMGMKPPQYLNVGDEVRLGIEGLGEQHQRVIKAPKPASLGHFLNKGE